MNHLTEQRYHTISLDFNTISPAFSVAYWKNRERLKRITTYQKFKFTAEPNDRATAARLQAGIA